VSQKKESKLFKRNSMNYTFWDSLREYTEYTEISVSFVFSVAETKLVSIALRVKSSKF